MTYLVQTVDDKGSSESAINLCAYCRQVERGTDPMYRMLSQSTQALFSNNLIHEIEETMVDAIIAVDPTASIRRPEYLHYFKYVSRFIKLIHSKRSGLVQASGGLTW